MLNKRNFRYGASKPPVDTVLSVLLGIVGWILFAFLMVRSIMTAGTLSAVYGYLYIMTFVLALWGGIFSIFSWRDDEGTIGIKRLAIFINFLLMIAMIVVVIL